MAIRIWFLTNNLLDETAFSQVVGDAELFKEWNVEMRGMSGRIDNVRHELQRILTAKMPSKDWSFITQQIGMFSFTGLTPAQVHYMRYRTIAFGWMSCMLVCVAVGTCASTAYEQRGCGRLTPAACSAYMMRDAVLTSFWFASQIQHASLPRPQVDNMTNKHFVFMTRDGRISLAGLNMAKCEYLADAIIDSIKTC